VESHAGELHVIRWAERPFDTEPAHNGFAVPLEAVRLPADAVVTQAASPILSPSPSSEGATT
jgi:hypothetical protein